MTGPDRPRLFLVDDHPLVRAALAQLLAGAGFAPDGQAGTPAEALAHPALAASHLALTAAVWIPVELICFSPITPPAVKQVDKTPAAEASVKPKESKDNDTKTSSPDGIEQDLTR